MTPVHITLVAPSGAPIANTTFTIQLSKSGFSDDVEGIALPRPVQATTDATGKVTVNLWPSETLYFIEVTDSESEAALFYKFVVPEVSEGASVRLQDIVVNGTLSNTHYDEAALAAIVSAKSNSRASELAAAASAASAASIVANVSADVAAALAAAEQVIQNGVDSEQFATAAAASATAAAADRATVQTLATTVSSQASQVSTDTAATETAKNTAVAAAANLTAAVTNAESSATAALSSKTAAEAAATTATAASTTATTKASEASTSASSAAASATAAAQAALDAANAAGNPVTSFNTRTGAVTLTSTDVNNALGFTPYNASNPSGYLTLAALLAVDGHTSGLDADMVDGIQGANIWHTGNFTPGNYVLASAYTAADVLAKLLTVDGALSGLDADLLDGQQGSYYLSLANATGTLDPARLTGEYTISVTGNAGTATALQTGRTLTIGNTGKVFNGTANLTWSLAELGAQAALTSGTNIKTVNGASLLGSGNVDVGGSVNGILKANGAGGYSAAVAGTDFVAPNGSITGNAATATKLASPVNINGVAFDGSAPITIEASAGAVVTYATQRALLEGGAY